MINQRPNSFSGTFAGDQAPRDRCVGRRVWGRRTGECCGNLVKDLAAVAFSTEGAGGMLGGGGLEEDVTSGWKVGFAGGKRKGGG